MLFASLSQGTFLLIKYDDTFVTQLWSWFPVPKLILCLLYYSDGGSWCCTSWETLLYHRCFDIRYRFLYTAPNNTVKFIGHVTFLKVTDCRCRRLGSSSPSLLVCTAQLLILLYHVYIFTHECHCQHYLYTGWWFHRVITYSIHIWAKHGNYKIYIVLII